jgi:hypothetical protein
MQGASRAIAFFHDCCSSSTVESAELPLPEWELESEEDLPPDTAADAIARMILAHLDRVPASP